MDWPAIAEPLLLERLGMGDDAFLAFMDRTLRSLPRRPFTPAVLATALGYPWERPARSFVLTGERCELLDDLGAARRDALVNGRRTGPDGAPRHPLLAFGSNGAPSTLTRKLAHLPDDERRVLVTVGELRGFDVGAAAQPTAYGSMAATLFESPPTATRAAVLWVSAAQLTQLTWTEISYRFGRLDDVAFVADEPEASTSTLFAYASRWGVFCPDGRPVAHAAIPARDRTAPALTQEELLGHAARAGLGAGATAATLVRAIFEDMAAVWAAGSPRIRAAGRPFAPAAWTPFGPAPDA